MMHLSVLVLALTTTTMLAASASPVGAERPLVGVYYYPWYGTHNPATRAYRERFADTYSRTLRDHLRPRQAPLLGYYSSRDPNVIAAHIDQSRRAGVDFWAISWWGPGHVHDETLRDFILTHPRAGEQPFVIHYESTGRLGTFAEPHYDNLLPDFLYLADQYLGRDNYFRIDDRPVVILYLTREFFAHPGAAEAVALVRRTLREQHGYDPFLIGDDFFSEPFDPERAKLWDAITSFDAYGMALAEHGSTPQGLERLAALYDEGRRTAEQAGVGFVPTVSPGYNDTAVREGHRPISRYLIVEGQDQPFGSLFERMLSDVALPRTDPKVDRLVMVNSFNEWYEDTQIEPVAPAEPTSVDDAEGRYTGGYRYEGYGDRYLQILRDAVDRAP